ncbi:acyltransferase family protein [Paenibacillus sp. FSL K6-2859]|uniref:acyltransferase family protein n=1 Tax=Paenibacillus sp. FSL K6-2859 TaxID=2921482 RepID=UPI0030F4C82D
MNKNRIEYLDSLRGISAMSVVIFHCMISFKIFHSANYSNVYESDIIKFITESPLKLLWAGTEPVLLFFVLSGFVLSISFYEGNEFNYYPYLLKRFSRIYIPYILIMIVSTLLASALMGVKNIEEMSATFDNRWDHSVSWKAMLAYIFMINYDTPNVNGVVWTLYHELRISLFFPFLLWVIVKWNALKSFVIIGFLIGSSFVVFFIISNYTKGFMSNLTYDFSLTSFYTMFFVFGAILSKYKVIIVSYLSNKSSVFRGAVFILSLFIINSRAIREVIPVFPRYIHELTVGVGIVLLFSVVLSSSLAQKLLMLYPFKWLGKISYSLYLTHILVLMLLAILLGNSIGIGYAIFLTPVVSLPVAWITHRYIEKPSIAIGRKLTVKNVRLTWKPEKRFLNTHSDHTTH